MIDRSVEAADESVANEGALAARLDDAIQIAVPDVLQRCASKRQIGRGEVDEGRVQTSQDFGEQEEQEELVRFRREWKKEVELRKRPQSCRDAEPCAASEPPDTLKGEPHIKFVAAQAGRASKGERGNLAHAEDVTKLGGRPQKPPPLSSGTHSVDARDKVQTLSHLSDSEAGPSAALQRALDRKNLKSGPQEGEASRQVIGSPIRLMRRAVIAYAIAVEAERRGQLDDALVNYRKAFKLDPHADRLYDRASLAVEQELDQALHGRSGGIRREMLVEDEDVRVRICAALEVEDHRFHGAMDRRYSADDRSQDIELAPGLRQDNSRKAMQHRQRTDPRSANTSQGRVGRRSTSLGSRSILSDLISKFEGTYDRQHQIGQATFAPADEEYPMLLTRLPDEIWMVILMFVAAPQGLRGAKIARHASARQSNSAGTKITNRDVPVETADATIDPPESSSDSRTIKRFPRTIVGIGVELGGPDFVSIEQLGRTCWKFRLLTRTWPIWSLIVRESLYPPQLPAKLSASMLIEKYGYDWRTMFIEQPRVRMNGAYIAAYHYTRSGVHQDNVWVRVIHVVEFYRTLRFLPDGMVLSLLTTDPPSETVRAMEPSLRKKGFATGRWTLHPDGLSDDEAHKRPNGAKVVIDDLHDRNLAGYSFRAVLKLDGRRGRWDRLEMLEYESSNLNTGEVCPLPMNHKKPFHFSPVRSYGI